jgi:hypothetical protein
MTSKLLLNRLHSKLLFVAGSLGWHETAILKLHLHKQSIITKTQTNVIIVSIFVMALCLCKRSLRIAVSCQPRHSATNKILTEDDFINFLYIINFEFQLL